MDWAVPHIVVSTASHILFNSAIDSGQNTKIISFPQKYTFAEMHPRPRQHSFLTTEKCRYHYTAEWHLSGGDLAELV